MMTFDEASKATLDQLTDELAAAGWDSTQTDINEARSSVVRLLCESKQADQVMTELDNAGFPSDQDWEAGATTWTMPSGVSIRVEGMYTEVIE